MIYLHNPRCSKSREGLELLEKKKLKPEIIEYLEDPLNEEELLDLFHVYQGEITELIRTKDQLYKELKLENKILDVQSIAKILSENPALLERPILINGEKAIVGRPVDNLLKIL